MRNKTKNLLFSDTSCILETSCIRFYYFWDSSGKAGVHLDNLSRQPPIVDHDNTGAFALTLCNISHWKRIKVWIQSSKTFIKIMKRNNSGIYNFFQGLLCFFSLCTTTLVPCAPLDPSCSKPLWSVRASTWKYFLPNPKYCVCTSILQL